MAIEMGKFKEKAAAAAAEKAAKEAKERADAEKAKAEQEAKGREGEIIAQELEAASLELSGAETSLAEAQQFAETELEALSPEDQESFRAQVSAEQQRADELKSKMAELQARKEAMEAGGMPEKIEEAEVVVVEPEKTTEEAQQVVEAPVEVQERSVEDLNIEEITKLVSESIDKADMDIKVLKVRLNEIRIRKSEGAGQGEIDEMTNEFSKLKDELEKQRGAISQFAAVFAEKMIQEKKYDELLGRKAAIDGALVNMNFAINRNKLNGEEFESRFRYAKATIEARYNKKGLEPEAIEVLALEQLGKDGGLNLSKEAKLVAQKMLERVKNYRGMSPRRYEDMQQSLS